MMITEKLLRHQVFCISLETNKINKIKKTFPSYYKIDSIYSNKRPRNNRYIAHCILQFIEFCYIEVMT